VEKYEFTLVHKRHAAPDPSLVGVADTHMLTFGQLSQTLSQFTLSSMDELALLFGLTHGCFDGSPTVMQLGGEALMLWLISQVVRIVRQRHTPSLRYSLMAQQVCPAFPLLLVQTVPVSVPGNSLQHFLAGHPAWPVCSYNVSANLPGQHFSPSLLPGNAFHVGKLHRDGGIISTSSFRATIGHKFTLCSPSDKTIY
jgi:hypothetical protein